MLVLIEILLVPGSRTSDFFTPGMCVCMCVCICMRVFMYV